MRGLMFFRLEEHFYNNTVKSTNLWHALLNVVSGFRKDTVFWVFWVVFVNVMLKALKMALKRIEVRTVPLAEK